MALLKAAAISGKPLSLKKLLPEYVTESLGTTCNGPNCFNAVVNFEKTRLGLAVKNVTSGDAELVVALDAHTLVDANAPRRPGDAVLFWHRAMSKSGETDLSWQQNLSAEVAKDWTQRDVFLHHAAVYVGGGLYFHKGAKGERFPWVFVNAENLQADYQNAIVTVHRSTRMR